MESRQERLAKEAGSNFQTYLSRMAASAGFSTKQNIPSIIRANRCHKILDVGCADGSFTQLIAGANPQASVEGLDINPECINNAELRCRDLGPSVKFSCGELKDLAEEDTYDCIVFSSVMHEISSYCEEELTRFWRTPIEDTIRMARKHLIRGGIIIIRDWVDATQGYSVNVRFRSGTRYADMFQRFVDEFPALGAVGGAYYWDEDDPNKVMLTDRILMEFLMVATWGEESWTREINERKFICDKKAWLDMAKTAGLKVIGWMETTEEYPVYCERIAEVTEDDGEDWVMPDTTFVMVCRKDD